MLSRPSRLQRSIASRIANNGLRIDCSWIDTANALHFSFQAGAFLSFRDETAGSRVVLPVLKSPKEMPRPAGRGRRGGRGGHAQRGKGQRRFDHMRPYSPIGLEERPESAVDDTEQDEGASGSEPG